MLSESCVPFGTKTTMNIYIFSTMVRFGSICETANLTLQASLQDMGKAKQNKKTLGHVLFI